MVYNKQDLQDRFERIGYQLLDVWQAHELSLAVPFYPEHDVHAYAGMFLRLREGSFRM